MSRVAQQSEVSQNPAIFRADADFLLAQVSDRRRIAWRLTQNEARKVTPLGRVNNHLLHHLLIAVRRAVELALSQHERVLLIRVRQLY